MSAAKTVPSQNHSSDFPGQLLFFFQLILRLGIINNRENKYIIGIINRRNQTTNIHTHTHTLSRDLELMSGNRIKYVKNAQNYVKNKKKNK